MNNPGPIVLDEAAWLTLLLIVTETLLKAVKEKDDDFIEQIAHLTGQLAATAEKG